MQVTIFGGMNVFFNKPYERERSKVCDIYVSAEGDVTEGAVEDLFIYGIHAVTESGETIEITLEMLSKSDAKYIEDFVYDR